MLELILNVSFVVLGAERATIFGTQAQDGEPMTLDVTYGDWNNRWCHRAADGAIVYEGLGLSLNISTALTSENSTGEAEALSGGDQQL